MSNLLENPVEPVNDFSFFDCLDAASEKSKVLRDGMTDISGNAKKGDMNAFDDAVKRVADAVIALTEAASQVCGPLGWPGRDLPQRAWATKI